MKKSILLISFFLISVAAFAQSDVVVNVQVVPPYSTYLSTYIDNPNKIILTLQNTTNIALDVKLKVSLEGDNRIRIYSEDNFAPSTAIHLNALELRRIDFSSNETRQYLDVNNIASEGITQRQLINNQTIPEGNYTICVQVFDFISNNELSVNSCSPIFDINYIDPPQTIMPQCEEEVVLYNPQNIVFTWTPPATMRGTTNYEFTLKEIPGRSTAYDAINSASVPVLFQTTISSATSLIYNSRNPILEKGKSYVWRVKALDPLGNLTFKNDGNSEACSFKISNDDAVSTSNTDVVPLNTNPPLDWTEISNDNNSVFPGQVIDDNSMGLNGVNLSPQNPVACTIKNFFLGAYNIEVAEIENCDLNKFTGYGWIYLWNNCSGSIQTQFGNINTDALVSDCKGPRVAVAFKGITLIEKNGLYQGIGEAAGNPVETVSLNSNGYYGYLLDDKEKPLEFPINIKEDLGIANWMIENVKLSSTLNGDIHKPDFGKIADKANVKAYIKWDLPFIGKDKVPRWYSNKKDFDIKPDTKFSPIGKFYSSTYREYDIVSPFEITLITKDVRFEIKKGNESEFTRVFFRIAAELPDIFHRPNTKYTYGEEIKNDKRVVINISEQTSFIFIVKIPFPDQQNSFLFHNNFKWKIVPTEIGIDLSKKEKFAEQFYGDQNLNWTGIWIKKAQFVLPSGDWGSSDIEKGTFSADAERKYDIDGKYTIDGLGKHFDLWIKEPVLVSYYGFNKAELNSLSFDVNNNSYTQTQLHGKVPVAFLNNNLNFFQAIKSEEEYSESTIWGKLSYNIVESDKSANDPYELKIAMNKIEMAISSKGLTLNGTLQFKDYGSEYKLQLPKVKFYGLTIDKSGGINDEGAMYDFSYYGEYGKIGDDEVSATGFNIISKKLAGSAASVATELVWKGFIGMGGLSGDGGSGYKETITLLQTYDKTKQIFKSKVVGVNFECTKDMQFDNGLTSFKSSVKPEIINDKICYTAELELNMSMLSPDAKVHGKLIIGKDVAPGGEKFNYWYIECGVDGLQIPIPPSDVVINGITGKVYSHMSTTNGKNYSPDKNTSFGVYVQTKLMTSADAGKRFWGAASFEVTTNPTGGLKDMTFRIDDAYIMSGGVNQTNAVASGKAEVKYVNWPKKRFSNYVDVKVNAFGVVCGTATHWLYIDDNIQHFEIGNQAKKAELNYFCNGLYKANTYFVAHREGNNGEANSVAMGSGFSFDTGKQIWTCFYGQAKMSMDAEALLKISPFQFSGTASVKGSVDAGFTAAGYTCDVISGELSADVELQFPNPTCLAGNLHGNGCIVGVCMDVDFAVRYKDGKFALKPKCSD